MFRWLQQNRFTQARKVSVLVKDSLEGAIPHARGSAARIITQATIRAYFAALVLRRSAMVRAVSLLQPLRSAASALIPVLGELDTAFAKEDLGTTRTFSDLGNDVVAAVEQLGKKLERFRGIDAPSTRARWKRFVGDTALALQKAGMPMTEIAALFSTPETGERMQQKLRRRATRKRVPEKRRTRAPKSV